MKASLLTLVLAFRHCAAFHRGGAGRPQGIRPGTRVPHGKVAADTYESKSLGFQRKFTIYTPPGYSKEKSTRCSTCSMDRATTRPVGSKRARLTSSWTISTRRGRPCP